MKKERNSALFIRILRTMLCALLVCFVINPGFAYNENETVSCDVGVLQSDESATFEAVWCQECTENALKTTTCELNTENATCSYTGDCRPGYENLTNAGTANLSCDLITYPISYYLYDGVNNPSNPSSYTVEDTAESAIVFSDPTKTGHTFNGWYNSASAAQSGDPTAVVTQIDRGSVGPVSVYAKWTANSYVVKYDCANPNGDISYSPSITYGTSAGQVPRVSANCTYAGFNPNGWLCKRTDNQQDVSSQFIEQGYIQTWNIDSNVDCVAQWTENEYSIVYKEYVDDIETTLTGLSPSSYTIAQLPLSITATPNTKIGYDFFGWCSSRTKENCSNPFVINNMNPQPQTIELWADWRLHDYSITYELNGGTNNTLNPVKYTIKDDIAFAEPEKTGYNFVGWSFVNSADNIETFTEGWSAGDKHEDIVLYAIWNVRTYHIYYDNLQDAQWATGSIHPESYSIESADFTISQPVRTGYEFKGWEITTAPDAWGAGSSQDGDLNFTIATGTHGEIHLEAVWEPITYNIVYHYVDDDQWGPYDTHPTEYNIEDENIYISNPVKNGYTFNGWCEGSVTCAAPITDYIISTGTYGNKDLYAQWDENEYTITYMLNGGTFGDNTPKNTYKITETFTLLNPTKQGYDFIGWCLNSTTCFSPENPYVISVGTTENLVFYAQWDAATYTVSYACDRYSDPVYEDTGVTYNNRYRFSDNINSRSGEALCEKTGFEFDTWACEYIDENQSTISVEPVDTEHWNIPYDVQCYSTWQENSFTVTFKPNSSYVENPDSMATITCPYEAGCVLPNNQYIYSGYEFAGWKSEDTTDTTLYPNGGTIKQKLTDVVLVAQWSNSRIWCNAGTYLPRNSSECAVCLRGSYCPESRFWDYSSSTNQGIQSCKTLMLNNSATSEEGSDSTDDCYVLCAAQPGYVLDPEHNKKHYGVEEECISKATIIYNGNNSCNSQQQTYSYSVGGTVNLCVPDIITGRTFIGWTDNKGNNYDIALNPRLENISVQELSPTNGFVVMTPNWDIETHTLTYDCGVNDKTVVVDDLEYLHEETLIDYATCNNPGYVFDGWLCDNRFYDAGETFIMPNADASCIAQVSPASYTVEFNGNNATSGTPSIPRVTCQYDMPCPQFASKDTLVKTGYNFNGWNTDANGTGTTYASGSTPTNLTTENDAVVTLYAKWTPVNYTISYVFPSDVTISVQNPSSYNITTPTFTLNNPVVQGYGFIGWCDSFDPDDSSCSTNRKIERGTTGNLVFYAQITKDVYHINYHYINEDGDIIQLPDLEPSTYTIAQGAVYPTEVNIPEYEFVAWYTSPELRFRTRQTAIGSTGDINVYGKVTKLSCGINEFIQDNKCVPCGNHSHSDGGTVTECECDSYYVKENDSCVAKQYTIDYVLNGGTPVENPHVYTVETNYTVLNNPTHPTATFLGWYKNADFSGGRISYIPGNLRENLTLYAKWQQISCEENYYIKNGRCVPCSDYSPHSHSSGGTATYCECDNGYEKLFDVCVLKEYNITYVLNGGRMPAGATNPQTYTVETPTTTLKEPVKDGNLFAGWYNNYNFSGNKITEIPGNLNGNLTLYAKWQQDLGMATITFDCGNGNVFERSEHIGLTVTPIDNSQCLITDGKLSGWNCAGATYALSDEITLHNDIVCNAIVTDKAEVYNIIYKAFDVHDDEIDLGNLTPSTYTTISGAVYPETLSVSGYVFGGWYTDKNLRFRTYRTSTNSTGTITVYAKLTPAPIHCDAGTYLPAGSTTCATCEANKYCTGGTFTYSTTLSQGESDCVAPYIYSKPGTQKAGYCYKDCEPRTNYVVSGVMYRNGLSSCEYSPMTYYITYVLNGGEFDGSVVNPQPYDITMPNITSLPVPTHSNKMFDAWLDENDVRTTMIRTKFGKNITLYAQWKTRPCEENYYMVGESCVACPDGLYSEGGYATQCTCKPGYEEHTSTTHEVYPAANVRIDSNTSSGNTWHTDVRPGTWMHNYADGRSDCRNRNASQTGGVWNDDNVVEQGSYCWCQMTAPYETKYIYSGKQDGSGCSNNCAFTCGDRARTNPSVTKALFENAYADGGADYEITTCEIITYNITYEGLEGSTHTNPSTYTVEDAGLQFTNPSNRDGYVFTGWTKDGIVFNEIPQGLTGDITLTANWDALSCEANEYLNNNVCVPCEEHSHSDGGTVTSCDCDNGYEKSSNACVVSQYTIDYVYNGGVMPDGVINPVSYNIETPVITLNNPIKEHFTFQGWYNNAEFDGNRISIIDPSQSTGNLTLYAKWEFECESGKWMHIGENKVCLYTEQQTHPSVVVDMNGTPYYMMLSTDSNLPIHDGTTQKFHVEYNGGTYNVHDASVQ